MNEQEQIEKALGKPLSDTAEYDSEDMRRVAVMSYFQGQRDATHSWAWWREGVQYVGCGVFFLKEAMKEIDKDEQCRLQGLDRGSM